MLKDNEMHKVVMSGANGYVASNFIVELLKLGYRVVALVRSKKSLSARQRMVTTLHEMGEIDPKAFERLEVYDYSLFEENFNLPAEQLRQIFSGKIHYFHFAASLKFDISSKEEIFGTNLQGVKHSVETFMRYSGSGSRFYFISTAYSCGKFEGIFEEKFYRNQGISAFRNYYEQSKRYAENVIRDYLEKDKLNASILRISQIVGNRETGVTNTDYGIFDFAKRIQRIAMRNPGIKLRLQIDPDCTQNLLPIDTVVSYFTQIIQNERLPAVLNLVSRNPIFNRDILKSLEQLLPIHLEANIDLKPSEMTALEKIIALGMSFTGAYIDINPQFDTANLDRVIWNKQPEVTRREIHQMLEYFLVRRESLKISGTG